MRDQDDALSDMAERFGQPIVQLPAGERPGLPKLTQTSRWSCIPTAFAMVLSKGDHSKAGPLLATIMKKLGRDDVRGFHIQELLGIALQHGWGFTPFDVDPQLERALCDRCEHGKVERQVNKYGDTANFDCEECEGTGLLSEAPLVVTPMFELLAINDGILIGMRRGSDQLHAAAWCSETQQVLDPEEGVYDLERFEVTTFWAAHNLKEKRAS